MLHAGSVSHKNGPLSADSDAGLHGFVHGSYKHKPDSNARDYTFVFAVATALASCHRRPPSPLTPPLPNKILTIHCLQFSFVEMLNYYNVHDYDLLTTENKTRPSWRSDRGCKV